MKLARALAVFTFSLAGAVSLFLSYAALAKTDQAWAPAPLFKWSDAMSRCTEQLDACQPGRLLELAASAPLSERPFSIQLGQSETRSAQLAHRLLRRDPRSSLARLTLAEHALRGGNQTEFLALFLPLFQTDRASADTYARVLAELGRDQGFRKEIAALLGADPPYWGERYITALSQTVALPVSEFTALARNYPRAQRALLKRMTQAGQWNAAYLAFIEFLSAPQPEDDEARLALTVPFNPALVEHSAPPPFNWRINSNGAEFLQAGGVYAFYQGRKAETFLTQVFPLSPGSHTIEIVQSGEASQASGYFRWTLACADSNTQLAELDVIDLKTAPGIYALEIVLEPYACAYQRLSLKGIAGTFPQPARIEVKSVRLQKQVAAEEEQ